MSYCHIGNTTLLTWEDIRCKDAPSLGIGLPMAMDATQESRVQCPQQNIEADILEDHLIIYVR